MISNVNTKDRYSGPHSRSLSFGEEKHKAQQRSLGAAAVHFWIERDRTIYRRGEERVNYSSEKSPSNLCK